MIEKMVNTKKKVPLGKKTPGKLEFFCFEN
jgi:hypothetical protein